jgi:urease accessory protein
MIAEGSLRPEPEQIPLFVERRVFLKRRWRGRAQDGTEFGFDLESRLQNGCVIHRTETADYVIWQEHEPVFVVRPASLDEAALLGWKIGNLHMPVEITGGEIRAQHDPAVKQLLEREGHAFEERTVLFQPLRVTAHAS